MQPPHIYRHQFYMSPDFVARSAVCVSPAKNLNQKLTFLVIRGGFPELVQGIFSAKKIYVIDFSNLSYN